MIELEKTLPILLNQYRSIHIPEFGTFFKFNEALNLIEDKNSYSFSTSNQLLTFKEEALDNDFLIKHFSFHLGQSYDSIKEEIASIVSNWKEDLKTNKIKKIPFIGNLVLDDLTNQLTFKPNNSFESTENTATFSKIEKKSLKHFFSGFVLYLTIFILVLAILYALFYNLTPYEIMLPEDIISKIKNYLSSL